MSFHYFSSYLRNSSRAQRPQEEIEGISTIDIMKTPGRLNELSSDPSVHRLDLLVGLLVHRSMLEEE